MEERHTRKVASNTEGRPMCISKETQD